MFPFVYAPTYEYPLSGDVSQGISPVFGEIAGLPEVEHEVVTTVASYGTQLGVLTDAILALAKKAKMLDAAEIVALQALADEVADAKIRARDAARARVARMQARVEKLDAIR